MNEMTTPTDLAQLRAEFEHWYATHAHNYSRDPIGSRDCSLQWEAWKGAHESRAQPASGLNVDALAQEIRRVDGAHRLGAAALADALMPFLTAQPASAAGWVMVPRKDAETVLLAGPDRNYMTREQEQEYDEASKRLDAALAAAPQSAKESDHE